MKSQTQVVLNKHVNKLGQPGTVHHVSTGYAYNYLIPNKLAQVATPELLRELKNRQALKEQQSARYKEELIEIKQILEQKGDFSILKKCGNNNVIFGSVTEKEVASTIREKTEFSIEKKDIFIKEKIQKLGTYKILVKLGVNIFATIKLNIISTESV
uniref:50S ribosomal protein L9, chloroplastic n=1 Tax=Gronococcus sybilensis TaxID=3028029 RepID=A0A9Y1I2E0_9RHOD|nr:ribosomal protein L9 [Gronococcus sybilensis]